MVREYGMTLKMMGATNWKIAARLGLAVILAVFIGAALADDEAVKSGQNAKKLALIHLLARAGKNEAAATEMRALYPLGPPSDDQALEYFRIIGNTAKGWKEASIGFKQLIKANPHEPRYRLALAQHLAARPATRRAGIQALIALAKSRQPGEEKQAGIDRQQILDTWRGALLALDRSPENIGLYREYLSIDSKDAGVHEALAVAQRTAAEREPWNLRDKADALLKEGHAEAAMTTLKKALLLAPANPWVRFDLARLYFKSGLAKQGRTLIDEGIAIAPDDPDMLYACALYLGLADEAGNALHLLNKIPEHEMTSSMLHLKQKMTIQSQIQQAKVLSKNGQHNEALALMESTETEAGDDAELVKAVADAWSDLGADTRSMSLLQRLLAQQPAAPIDLNLRYATLLNRAERDDELATLLDQINSAKALSDNDREDLRYLRASLTARRADNLRHAGEYAAANAILAPALKNDPENPDLLKAQARVYIAANQPEQARVIYQRILELEQRNFNTQPTHGSGPMLKLDYGIFAPGDVEIRLSLARLMDEIGDRAAAHHQFEIVLANTAADDVNTRLSIANWYLETNNIVTARRIVEPLRQTAPDNPQVLMMSGRIAEATGHAGLAMDYFKQAKADEEIARMKRNRASYIIATGVDYLSKTGGTPGISNLTAIEIPLEVRMPVGFTGNQFFVQIDPVSADAGVLQSSDLYNLRQYGKVLALAPTGAGINNTSQSAHGTALGVGYDGAGLRADIGTTPLGFPVSDVVGGVKWSHYTETSGFSFEVSRRPVTSTLLSYAGAHDPVTGEVWGGVRNNGISMHTSRDKGRLNGFVDLGYYWLTGKNVLNNTEAALRTGFDWSLIHEDDTRLSAGLTFTNWRYRENLRYYTFGHGGYYSPQNYYSLAFPVIWTGRTGNWSYLLNASVSASVSHEKDMPFYPINPALQAQGNANASTMSPYYIGGGSHGTGFSLSGSLEKLVASHLFVGGHFTIDRSAYYTPNYAILYLRYQFDAHTGPVPYPPDPVKAYSHF
jgi:tetratricopeptide (TPR) repeat protein